MLGSEARRLTARHAPDAYVGVVVRVIEAASVDRPDVVERTPDHFLGALWAPAASGPARWPDLVVIGSPRAENAIVQLLEAVPADRRLYLADRDGVDAGLAARILLASDRNLEPYQRAALDAFIAAERSRERDWIAARYSDRDPRYEQFRAVVLREPPDRHDR